MTHMLVPFSWTIQSGFLHGMYLSVITAESHRMVARWYPYLVLLSSILRGLSDMVKSNGLSESPWNIPVLIMIGPVPPYGLVSYWLVIQWFMLCSMNFIHAVDAFLFLALQFSRMALLIISWFLHPWQSLLPPLCSGVTLDSFSRWLYNLSVMTDDKILKVVGRQDIGPLFFGINVSSFLGSRLVVTSTSHWGTTEYAIAMGLWRLLNCLIQKLGSLSGPGASNWLL